MKPSLHGPGAVASQDQGPHREPEGAVLARYARGAGPVPPSGIYRLVRGIARVVVLPLVRLRVEGAHHLPVRGPFILVANHQSVLDPVLVQASCPRPVHTLTKSSQFGTPPFGWLLPRIFALPARRYRVDAQVVRIMLRRLAQGEVVGIYPEGERTWDGTLQPMRRGTVRVLLRAGVPVVPCGITGAFRVWPRWGRPRLGPVTLRFGAPLTFSVHRSRPEREAALPEAMERLSSALRTLSDDLPERDGEESPGLPPGWTLQGSPAASAGKATR